MNVHYSIGGMNGRELTVWGTSPAPNQTVRIVIRNRPDNPADADVFADEKQSDEDGNAITNPPIMLPVGDYRMTVTAGDPPYNATTKYEADFSIVGNVDATLLNKEMSMASVH